MNQKEKSKQLNVYLPGLPSLSSDDLAHYILNQASRIDLVKQIAAANMHVADIDGAKPWVETMQDYASQSDAFLFPPMTSLPDNDPRFKIEAAQRWFEFFSLVTGMAIGSGEKFGKNGLSKPCVVMDPDGQWKLAIDLLKDLKAKGMFSSTVEDIVTVSDCPPDADDITMNRQAVNTLQQVMADKKGKSLASIHYDHPDEDFQAFREDVNRHPFGVAIFGSASTTEKSYLDAVSSFGKMLGERGWRMISGAGQRGCMNAADVGFGAGAKTFNQRYPQATFKPTHVGVSTMGILRLEGPPQNLSQLIISDNIYDRLKIMINGKRDANPLQRSRDATRVIVVTPGGTGTVHEFATMLQLATHGGMMNNRKIILLNVPSHLNPKEGFWDTLIATAKKLGFDNMFEVANSPEQAIEIADKAYQEWVQARPEHKNLPHPVFNKNPSVVAR